MKSKTYKHDFSGDMKNSRYRIQILDAGKWYTLALEDRPLRPESDAMATRDYFAAINVENDYRAQIQVGSKWKSIVVKGWAI